MREVRAGPHEFVRTGARWIYSGPLHARVYCGVCDIESVSSLAGVLDEDYERVEAGLVATYSPCCLLASRIVLAQQIMGS